MGLMARFAMKADSSDRLVIVATWDILAMQASIVVSANVSRRILKAQYDVGLQNELGLTK